jgi:hypothetical protein
LKEAKHLTYEDLVVNDEDRYYGIEPLIAECAVLNNSQAKLKLLNGVVLDYNTKIRGL